MTRRPEEVPRFYGMSWPSSFWQALTPVNDSLFGIAVHRDNWHAIVKKDMHRLDAAV